jgi:aquaporin Z
MSKCAEGFAKPGSSRRIECSVRIENAPLHLTEYAIEATAIGTFMMSAAAFATLLYHPASPMAEALPDGLARRALMGLAMGGTAVSIIYSRWGQRSGAHMNPAVTLTYFRLGKVAPVDLAGYVAAQFTGSVLGMMLAFALLGSLLSNTSVHFVATRPGPAGSAVAFMAEAIISFLLMMTVLFVSNHRRWARFTGLCAGLLVWTYIALEAPLSGMSMNPARTLGSALLAQDFSELWIYFTAPPIGMLLAAELFARRFGLRHVVCAKLHHPREGVCIFGCAASSLRTLDPGMETPAQGAASKQHPIGRVSGYTM